MRRFSGLVAAALVLAAGASLSLAPAEEVEESWRSPFGTFRSISVNRLDGSCWVSSGSHLLHLGANGQLLAQVSGLVQPMGVSVNESDGSCWVAEEGRDQVLHVAADGTVLTAVPGLHAGLVAVNPANGSCAVAIAVPGPGLTWDYLGLVCLAEGGTELWRAEVGMVSALAASPADGSWWLAGGSSQVARVRADGTEAWRHDISITGDAVWLLPTSLSVNAADGTAWVTDDSDFIHLSPDGAELGRIVGPGPRERVSVSVDSSDGSLWVGTMNSAVGHLTADGDQLLWITRFGGHSQAVESPVASPADGSCWILARGQLDYFLGELPLFRARVLAHVAADGTQLSSADDTSPASLASDPLDGSCWAGVGADLVHLAPDGTEVQRISTDYYPLAVGVDAANGSVWVAACIQEGDLLHLSADGTELLELPSFPFANAIAVNPSDGSCWIVAGVYYDAMAAGRTGTFWPGEAIHVAEDGTILVRVGGFTEPRSVSVDPGDGSCWLASEGQVIHLAEDGTELSRTGEGYEWVSVDSVDGSCWAAGNGSVAHLARDGSELWRRDGYSAGPLSVNASDGSCWMSSASVVPPRTVHFAADGTELWASTDLAPEPDLHAGTHHREAASVSPIDGSCWVSDLSDREIVRFTVVGYPAQHFGDVLRRHWAFAAIEACAAAGIVQGYEDGYHPGQVVTRDQMAVYISRALAGGDEGVTVPTGVAEPTFTDVGEDFWAYRYIEYCVGANIVQGYDDGGYHPDEVVNRGQMAVYIARALVTPSGDEGIHVPSGVAETTFPDVTPENDWAWCYPHVEYCAAEAIVQGYADGAYRPEEAVTRDQMAVYIARARALVL